jgi:molecular chaperone GrpE
MLSFVGIYEDFIRAKSALEDESANIQGLEGIIKNMKSLLNENHIEQIEAKGKIFDPKFHEAVLTVEDNSLDEGTITQEVAKGYISSDEVIKPSKVIVSKKNEKGEMKNG